MPPRLTAHSTLLDEIETLVKETNVTVGDMRSWTGPDGTFVDYQVALECDAPWHTKHPFVPRRTFAEFQWLAEQLTIAGVHFDPLPVPSASADEFTAWLAAIVQVPANLVRRRQDFMFHPIPFQDLPNVRRFLQYEAAVVPESRPLVFSTPLDALSRDDILELPPYYLTAIAANEHFDTHDCLTRFELADRIASRGVMPSKDQATEAGGMGFAGMKRDDADVMFQDNFSSATPQPQAPGLTWVKRYYASLIGAAPKPAAPVSAPPAMPPAAQTLQNPFGIATPVLALPLPPSRQHRTAPQSSTAQPTVAHPPKCQSPRALAVVD